MKTSEEPFVKQADISVQPALKRPGVRPLLTFFAVLAVLMAAGIVAGLLPKLRREKGLKAVEETQSCSAWW